MRSAFQVLTFFLLLSTMGRGCMATIETSGDPLAIHGSRKVVGFDAVSEIVPNSLVRLRRYDVKGRQLSSQDIRTRGQFLGFDQVGDPVFWRTGNLQSYDGKGWKVFRSGIDYDSAFELAVNDGTVIRIAENGRWDIYPPGADHFSFSTSLSAGYAPTANHEGIYVVDSRDKYLKVAYASPTQPLANEDRYVRTQAGTPIKPMRLSSVTYSYGNGNLITFASLKGLKKQEYSHVPSLNFPERTRTLADNKVISFCIVSIDTLQNRAKVVGIVRLPRNEDGCTMTFPPHRNGLAARGDGSVAVWINNSLQFISKERAN